MKASTILKRAISLISLLLIVAMMFTACGGEKETPTESNSSEQTSENSSEVTENVSTSSLTVSDEGTSSVANENVSSNGGGANTAVGDISEYKNAPKKEVHVLMWREYTKTEKSYVDGYMKKTGVRIRTTVTTENEYPTKLISLVSGGDSPDVVQFNNQWFPGLVVKALQPLNDKYFQLDNKCWYKAYMDPYKINGKYFGVAMNKSWSCEDCAYVTYYNPAVLRQCGISAGSMPYDLYKQGKWNWDKQSEIARLVSKYGKGGYTGISVQSRDVFMYSAGADFASYDGKKYTNNLGSVSNNSMITRAWKTVAELGKDNYITDWDLNNVQQGKIGLFTAIAYGLYNEGKYFDNVAGGYSTLQAVPVAGPNGGTAYVPVRPKVWGVAKKAKNPEGAAYFLRYWLDASNCNMSSTFYNKQFETIYNIITDKSTKKHVMVGVGIGDYVKAGTYHSLCGKLSRSTPANITTVLNSNKDVINSAINRANMDISRLK